MTREKRCQIESTVVQDSKNPFRGISYSVCRTHEWHFEPGTLIGPSTACPIGRIERAADEAIERILVAAALRGDPP